MTAIAPGVNAVRHTIEHDLGNEPQSVVRVSEIAKLAPDIKEYVLTDQLAREFGRVLERVIDAARPGGVETDKVGIWVRRCKNTTSGIDPFRSSVVLT